MSRMMAFAAALALTASANAADAADAANAGDALVLQLHGPEQFEFAGYYAALWKGFYAEAGLSVEIRPGAARGQAPIDPVREVTEGRAQFGTGGGAGLVIRTAQGLPLVLLMPVFQQSGAAVYYRADADYPSPAALVRAKLGRPPASDVLDIELATALRAEGIDPGRLKSVSLETGQIAAALADRTVDAAVGSAWEVPWLAREKGIALKSFNPADYRVEFYGDTLFALQRLAKTQPDTVHRFRAAALKGWEYALQYPDEIAGRLTAALPHPAGIADAAGFARYQAELARRLARYPDIPLGHSNPERWNRIEASLIDAGSLLRIADTDDFVYDPDAEARSRTDLRALAILGMTLAGGLVVTALLWLRWRRRPVRAGAAGGEQPLSPPLSPPAPGAEPPVDAPAGAPVVPAGGRPVAADLNAMLNRLERAIRQRVPRGVSLRFSLLPELWRCQSDVQTVRPLVLDLVAAAASDLKPRGELIVGTRNYAFDEASAAETPGAITGEFARLTVRDSGSGLSEPALAQVFDPAATRRPSAAAAAAAMGRLGGFVRVESAEGVGTAVHLFFPRIAEAAPAPTPAPGAKDDKPAEAAE